MRKKVTFEIEMSLDGDERMSGFSFSVLREGNREYPTDKLSFTFTRPQRVRNGKHISANLCMAKIVHVGEKLPGE